MFSRADSLNWEFARQRLLSYAPRRPDLDEVACGLTFGAEGGAGLAPLGAAAPGTLDWGL